MASELTLHTPFKEPEARHQLARALNLIAVYWFLPPGSRPLLIRFFPDRFEVYRLRYASRLLLGPTVFRGKIAGGASGAVIRGHFSVAWLFRLLFAAWIVTAWLFVAGFAWLSINGSFSNRDSSLWILPLIYLAFGLAILSMNRKRSAEEKKFILRYLQWALQARITALENGGSLIFEKGETAITASGQNSSASAS